MRENVTTQATRNTVLPVGRVAVGANFVGCLFDRDGGVYLGLIRYDILCHNHMKTRCGQGWILRRFSGNPDGLPR